MPTSPHHIKPDPTQRTRINITPESAGWEYLSFRVVQLEAGEALREDTGSCEVAIVPLEGAGTMAASGNVWATERKSVFTQMPDVLYVPPGKAFEVIATSSFTFAIGSAPAEGRYPTRLFRPEDQRVEVRGHMPALREVHHTLAWPLPAERLILFEVYVPGSNWSGWPPHCHDRYMGSPYLEEIYYYQMQPENGVAFHRNYRLDTDFDEVLPVRNGDSVVVTGGFHPVVPTPGTNIYFLNYLAGELEDDDRNYVPYEDPHTTWIKENWEGNAMDLPIRFGGEKGGG